MLCENFPALLGCARRLTGFFGTLPVAHLIPVFTKALAMTTASSLPRVGKTASETAPPYRSEHQRDVINRLRRIEGQVRALVDMVENGRPCEDVAQQMSAARKAMDKAFYRMMACSVMEAVTGTDVEADVQRSTLILEKYA